MAHIYSEDSTRDLGGDWGWIERKTLAPELEKVAFNLPAGRVSNIVELGGNFYILKVEEKTRRRIAAFAEVRVRNRKEVDPGRSAASSRKSGWPVFAQKAYIRTF